MTLLLVFQPFHSHSQYKLTMTSHKHLRPTGTECSDVLARIYYHFFPWISDIFLFFSPHRPICSKAKQEGRRWTVRPASFWFQTSHRCSMTTALPNKTLFLTRRSLRYDRSTLTIIWTLLKVSGIILTKVKQFTSGVFWVIHLHFMYLADYFYCFYCIQGMNAFK